ncbi:SDR family NAD(P)-dependent oxidoreductase [Rhodococcus sp. JVH1]|uniref:SDR family NAD(P)-dependent oxidoreductase n=1 Tax=Rhodococcus sp. JVH1 TaxID=745408 RepID=UPI000271FEF7|nr:glucose 1-dehydrogenase [Rhodococcus sp. JVH1]EJI93335.1 3-alpha-(or 20-beta)-hydroxysteroid dehydrogenase [Rhodococcus sp. JVH1]
MNSTLEGRGAIVTGAARGLGAAIGRVLAERGARVLFADVLDDDGEKHAAQLRTEGLEVHYTHLDVTDETSWGDAVELAQRCVGGVAVLVNNAGISGPGEGIASELEGWDSIVAVNQTGPFLGMRAVTPAMRAAGGGSIINIASIMGYVGDPDYLAYTATKGAVRQMTRSVALELAGDRIRVNTVCPGYIKTSMNDDELDLASSIDDTPLKRLAEPAEIARAVAFLASDDSSYMTGSDLVVDGGYLAR